MFINREEICNLSRVPVDIENNPCYKTVLQLINVDMDYKQTVLYEHYKSYTPKTLYDLYGVGESLKKYSFDCLFLPWIHTSPVTEYSDVAFIQRNDAFISAQVKKIKALINSIREIGFKPGLFLDRKGGNITGYFLHNNKKKFYVVSGNHRVATLSALFPDMSIPVVYEEEKYLKPRDRKNRIEPPRKIYSYKNIENWPSVVSGFINQSAAREIMEKYTNGIS